MGFSLHMSDILDDRNRGKARSLFRNGETKEKTLKVLKIDLETFRYPALDCTKLVLLTLKLYHFLVSNAATNFRCREGQKK